jgi:hypothetical protein
VSEVYKMTYRSIIGDSIEYIPRKTKEDRTITVRIPYEKRINRDVGINQYICTKLQDVV